MKEIDEIMSKVLSHQQTLFLACKESEMADIRSYTQRAHSGRNVQFLTSPQGFISRGVLDLDALVIGFSRQYGTKQLEGTTVGIPSGLGWRLSQATENAFGGRVSLVLLTHILSGIPVRLDELRNINPAVIRMTSTSA